MITLDHSARFLIVSMRDVLMSRRKSLNLAQAGNVSLLTLVARCALPGFPSSSACAGATSFRVAGT
jgi:hypothetical protein